MQVTTVLLRIPSKKKCGLRLPPCFTNLLAGASPQNFEEETNEDEEPGMDLGRCMRITYGPSYQSE